MFALTTGAIIFSIIGLLLRFLAPDENKVMGYRTKTSMASKANWGFSQKY